MLIEPYQLVNRAIVLLSQIVLSSACGKQKMEAKFIHAVGLQYRFHHWSSSCLVVIGNSIFRDKLQDIFQFLLRQGSFFKLTSLSLVFIQVLTGVSVSQS